MFDFLGGLVLAASALGLWFWVIFTVAFLSIMISVETERFSITTPATVIAVGVLMWFTGFQPIVWMKANGWTLATWVAIYFAVGVIWGVVKWFFYLVRVRDDLVAYRKEKGIPAGDALTEEARDHFIAYFMHGTGSKSIPPKAAQSKARITFWMIYWPFSMPWTLLNEPIKRLFNFLYNRIAGFLQGMSDRLFRDIS